ncbi:MAG: SRPBCC family protein [Actinomycetota bacterium]|nr:SRPBCC family protein [Actinomycetota bacterium]
MGRPMSVSESVVIAADPATVYAQISDPTQTGRWSPENTGAVVEGRAGSLPVGAVFVGRNQRFKFSWVTRCRVTVADPGERFEFCVEAIGRTKPRLKAPIATWTYDLEPIGDSTRVTETWADGRRKWPDGLAKVFDKLATRSTFAEFNAKNMRTTLDNLKRELESSR